jgi:hypothetical protein
MLESLPRRLGSEPPDLRGVICGRKDIGETDAATDAQNPPRYLPCSAIEHMMEMVERTYGKGRAIPA